MTTIYYKKGYKYQIVKDYRIYLGVPNEVSTPFIKISNGIMTIKAGYSYDGPSGPTIDTKNFMRGSLIHDALYQLIANKKFSDRKLADKWLRDICKEDGMCSFRAWYIHLAVRTLGKYFLNKKKIINNKKK